MMKWTTRAVVLAAATLLALLLATGAQAKNHKVTICHKGKEISVSERAVDAHVRNHGDTVGPCEAPPEEGACPCWTAEQVAAAADLAANVEEFPNYFCFVGQDRFDEQLDHRGGALFTNDSSGNEAELDVEHEVDMDTGMVEFSACQVDVFGEAEFGIEPISVEDLTMEEIRACQMALVPCALLTP